MKIVDPNDLKPPAISPEVSADYSKWVGPGHTYAMPLLVDIPKDATNSAKGRKIYRQFFADYRTADPAGGVTLVGTLKDKTTTTFPETTP
jgi:hypothetical protein